MKNDKINIRSGELIKKKALEQAMKRGETLTAYIKRLILEDAEKKR